MVVLTNFVTPTEGIKLQLPSTSVMINNREIGSGIIFITESTLSWVNDDSGEGFALEYPHISLHAVSRDRSSCPHENLYVMLDIPWDDPENEVQEVNSDDEDEDSVDMTELRFIPNDKGMLDAMFHAICECQALHPDPQDSFSEGSIVLLGITILEANSEDASRTEGETAVQQANLGDDDEEGIFEDEDEEGEYELGGSDQVARAAADPVESTNGDLSSSEPMEMDAGQFEDADCDPEN